LNGQARKHKIYTVNLVDFSGGGGPKIKPAPVEKTPPVKKEVKIITKKTVSSAKKAAMTYPAKIKDAPKKEVIVRKSEMIASEKEEIAPKKDIIAPKKEVIAREETSAREGEGAGEASPGAAISLDSSTFPYLYYLKILKNKIYENWKPPLSIDTPEQTENAIIFFKILKSGDIVDPKIEKSSGFRFFDQSALRAVIQASPLPPLPQEFQEEFLGVHMGFKQPRKG